MNNLIKSNKYFYLWLVSLGYLILRSALLTEANIKKIPGPSWLAYQPERDCPDYVGVFCTYISGYQSIANWLSIIATLGFIIFGAVLIILTSINFYRKYKNN